ncbi:uncharacterized protein LOC110448887 [Mizuhopecten yessoensis]|uniref:uncharacterized protein LOC110448887 n=1 Tax=Mizuhopecten yessoensis TaxID=6573 RepID=UPI000B45847C|nr:uncharacterized protein LOC110448887 [Mizuhopecten yessoensis]
MAHLNKKKLSLSERFGTIVPVDYQSKACKNSEMVSKLQMQITEVVRKRTDGNVRESQAKMISEEISDVQQRSDDAPVACQKFTPFKIELKVNKGNKQAENQEDTERKVHNYNAGNIEGSNNTDNNEKSQDYVNRIEVCHDSGLNNNPIKEYGSKNNGTSVPVTGFIAEEPKFKNNGQGSMGKCRNDERDLNIQPSPKFYQDTSSFNTHQHYDVERNSTKKWLKKNAEYNSPLNTAKNLPRFQEQPKKYQNESLGNQKTYQSWKQNKNAENYSGQNNKKQKADFKKTNRDQTTINFRDNNGAQTSQNFNRTQSSKSSPNLNKGKGPKFKMGKGSKGSPKCNNEPDFKTSPKFNTKQGPKTSPIFNKGPGFQTSPNLNYGQGCNYKASPNFNNGQHCNASPNLNTGPGCKASPNLNKGQVFQTSSNLNKGQGFQTSPNLNKGQGFQTSPNLNKGQGFQTSPNLNKGQGFQTSTNLNKGPGFQTSPNLNKGQVFQANPNLNKGQGFQTSPNLNKGPGFQTSPNLNKGQGFQANSNLNKGQGFQTSSNLNKGPGFQTSPNLNKGQGFQTSSNLNKGPGFQTSPNLNKGQGFQTSSNLNKGPGFQTSPNLNKGQGFQTKLDFNKKQNIQTSQSFNKRPGFQTSPNFGKSPDLNHINDIHTSANNRQCSEVSPNQNNGQKFQTSSDFNKGKDFQASPNFNKGPGFQASTGFKQNNVPKSFGYIKTGPRNTPDSQTNVQQHFVADTFASDDPCTIYDIQDQFYNYHSKKRFPKGRQQRANFYNNNNKPGFGGHMENQQRSFSSNPLHQYHVNQARQCNLQAPANNVVQPPEYTSSEQLFTAGGFGKRHASPVGSNKHMSPAKKRMLATDPLNKDIPSFQNRHPSSNPPWQGNHCKVSSDNNYVENQSLPYGYYPGHVPNTPFHPPVAGNYGLALHGPFTPKTWNAPTKHNTSNFESADARATLDNKVHPLNETDGLSSTKHYLFNKMLDQNDTRRSTGVVLKPAEDNVKPFGDVKPTGDIVQPSGGIVKPTGFYQEIANESSGMTATIHKEKEETELVSTLLTQCQAMAQKDDDRQALHTIFNIIQQEMGHQPFQASSVRSKIPSTDYKPEQTQSFSDASMNGDDAKFSPTSSSPDAASKQNGNIRFEGRTLLKGGVKPRHIPKTLVNRQDDDPPRDPRPVKVCKKQPLTARKMKDLPLPPFFIEFVATEKFGKKNDDGKLNQALHQDTKKNMNEVHNKCVTTAAFKTTDVKTGIGKIDDYIESNLGIKQQEEKKENIVAETKQEKCSPDTLETRNSDGISHILPRITVRQEQGVSVSDKTSLKKDHYVDVNSRDPRLRATSISKKKDDNPIVDLLVLKYEECRVGQQHTACDDVNGKALECVLEPEQAQSGGSKECNEANLVTKLSRDGLQSRQSNSPIHHKDTSGRETIISRSSEKSSRHCSVPKDIAKEFSSGKLPIHQRRYSESGNGSTKEIDRFHSSPSRRYSRFSSERSLSRSRSSSRSRDEEWTEKEVAIRRTNNVNFSHRNMCLSQSYERNTVVYSRDRHSEHNRNRFQERDEHDRMNKERNSMSPGTCRYLKRRDLERRSTPPSSTNRNVYKSQYQGRRNRKYSEGSDYPESCSSPLR